MEKRIWLTWEVQRRNKSMSSHLNATLYEITASGFRLKRYPKQILNTIKVLAGGNAEVIFVQNPSLLLSAIVVLYGRVASVSVIVDVHNAGIFPLEGRYYLLNLIAKLVNSMSTKVIVSNKALIKYIYKNKKDIFAIADPIPVIMKKSEVKLVKNKKNIVFICSWSEDEPFDEVIKVAKKVSDIAHIYMTGNSRGKEKEIYGIPENISITGFLDNNKYDDLIYACDAVMVLTKRKDCLVCGAYEGVAVGKPLILSKTNVLMEYFNKGSVYADNTCAGIEVAIRQLDKSYTNLVSEIKVLKKELEKNMEVTLGLFNKEL